MIGLFYQILQLCCYKIVMQHLQLRIKQNKRLSDLRNFPSLPAHLSESCRCRNYLKCTNKFVVSWWEYLEFISLLKTGTTDRIEWAWMAKWWRLLSCYTVYCHKYSFPKLYIKCGLTLRVALDLVLQFSSFYILRQKTAPQKPTSQVEENCAMEVIAELNLYLYCCSFSQ